jgi:cellulose synthase/poly-beta-1,6-N-acetylglucosamine synthase-like glycosyltransferase
MLEALASPRISVVRLARNHGRALVRNEGVRRLAEVDYVVNVDCDDKLSPDYLAKLVEALEAAPRAGVAYGMLHYFGALHPTGAASWPDSPYQPARRYLENVIPGPGTMIRAAALAQTAGWRKDFTRSSGEDYDIWLQVVEAGWDAIWVRDAVYHYRQHAQSFLAVDGAAMHLEMTLNILRWHRQGIAEAGVLEDFLRPEVMPALYAALRRRDAARAGRIVRTLARCCPATALRLAGRYYLDRLLAGSRP